MTARSFERPGLRDSTEGAAPHQLTPELSAMNMHLSYEVSGNVTENGMGRFFSPTNLSRYRKLADDKIDVDDRNRILEALAEEWRAFTNEFRTSNAVPRPVRPKNVVFQEEDSR
jgi:hypothetical protein